MRIEIDTKHDSQEDIKHAIKMLMSAADIEHHELFSNSSAVIEESKQQDIMEEPAKQEGFVNFFDTPAETKLENTEEEKEQPSVGGFFNMDIQSETNEKTSTIDTEDEVPESDAQIKFINDDKDTEGFYKTFDDDENKDTKEAEKPKVTFYN